MPGILDAASGALGMSPLGLATTGVSLAGQVFGAIKAGKQAKANQKLLDQKQAENEADYNKTANQSFLDTAVAKDAVKEQKQALQDNQKAVAGRAAITGASDEAVVAGQTGAQKNYSDAVSRLAGAGTQYQTQQKSMYLARKDSLDNQQMQLNNQKAESAANLMGNAGDLMNTVAFTEGMKGKLNPLSGVNQFGRTPGQENALRKIAKTA